jgi:hypothetical protein
MRLGQGSQGEEEIQLGFAEEVEEGHGGWLFEDKDWEGWDGGKIGGKPVRRPPRRLPAHHISTTTPLIPPLSLHGMITLLAKARPPNPRVASQPYIQRLAAQVWLDPVDLPSCESVACACCGNPLSFLLEVYCPLDEPPEAFHRALYVLVCQKPACQTSLGVRALRCQLPRRNPYYPYEGGAGKGAAAGEGGSERPRLCDVCGMRGEKVCGGCRQVAYCSRAHQKEAWKGGHKSTCKGTAGGEGGEGSGGSGEEAVSPATTTTTTTTTTTPAAMKPLKSVLREFEVVIDFEYDDSDEVKRREDARLLKKYKEVLSTGARHHQ